jgi:hypothetical protein
VAGSPSDELLGEIGSVEHVLGISAARITTGPS